MTIEATKFVGPHKSCMHHDIINFVHWGQMIGPQSTQTTLTLPIRYSPLSLSCPARSHIEPQI
jgi:hypothetical protein